MIAVTESGYHSMKNWRKLHARVEALGADVAGVVYCGEPTPWVMNAARVAQQADAACIVIVKGTAPESTMAIVPFTLLERLLAHKQEKGET